MDSFCAFFSFPDRFQIKLSTSTLRLSHDNDDDGDPNGGNNDDDDDDDNAMGAESEVWWWDDGDDDGSLLSCCLGFKLSFAYIVHFINP